MESYSYFCNTRIEKGFGKAKQLPKLLESLQSQYNCHFGKYFKTEPFFYSVANKRPIMSDIRESGSVDHE